MAALRHTMIGAGLKAFRTTGLHRALAPWTRGCGAILAFHHVRPASPRAFAPNRLLDITPEHLDAVLRHVARRGYEVVPLAAVVPRLRAGTTRPFVALTFDDGYRDNVVHALPVLERHGAPFTVFVTTGFADRTARLWWTELEAAIGRADAVHLRLGDVDVDLPARTGADKERAFDRMARRFRRLSDVDIDAALDALGCSQMSGRTLVGELCLGWDELARLGDHPLATLGAHTATHPSLATLDPAALHRELAGSRATLEHRLGRPVTTLAYPYGGRDAAGPREIAAAARAGFAAAVTTRPGVLRRTHAETPTGLPRLSVNGLWPDVATLDILLSGAPFALAGLSGFRPARRARPAAPSSGSAA